jgi:hypothetical protein
MVHYAQHQVLDERAFACTREKNVCLLGTYFLSKLQENLRHCPSTAWNGRNLRLAARIKNKARTSLVRRCFDAHHSCTLMSYLHLFDCFSPLFAWLVYWRRCTCSSRGYADQRVGDEGKASLDAPMGETAVAWKCLGVAKRNEMPSQVNGVGCGLFTCKAVENLVDCLPLAGCGDGSRRGGFSADRNASMNRRRLIMLIGHHAGWAGMPAAAP